ncbi:unnamed protein product [Anisakis simplex]|uniref:Chloride channel protein n=1 Tax=Anisakis simplex TaxID=6269 RepID=A0A0M3JTR4_ANISI|nr:unnamed protein product [Anisakis simplex]
MAMGLAAEAAVNGKEQFLRIFDQRKHSSLSSDATSTAVVASQAHGIETQCESQLSSYQSIMRSAARLSKLGLPPYTRSTQPGRSLFCNPCQPQKMVRFFLEDWLFLAVLGVLMAFLSLSVDACIDQLQTFHLYFMNMVERTDDGFLNFILTYIVWMTYTMVVMLASVIFVHYVGPCAIGIIFKRPFHRIGSGIPEIKTILRGVRLKEYLSFRTFLAKMVGLALAIGSGFPIGKEACGPFVHVGSIIANLIGRMVRSFEPAYANESRSAELLAAGCAAGVACTFSAPIGAFDSVVIRSNMYRICMYVVVAGGALTLEGDDWDGMIDCLDLCYAFGHLPHFQLYRVDSCFPFTGVLFSIEVTAVYFAVRDYWRGFFAAACGSALFSLLRLYTHDSEVTVVAFYQTTFKYRAFYPEELVIFAMIGLFCGLSGAIFIYVHRHLVLFLRRNSFMKIIFQRNWIVYPIVISAVYATLTHPIGFGRHITGEVVFSRTLKDFFMNCTWSADPTSFEACGGSVAARWSADESIFAELAVFVIGFYFLSIVASTLPVPAGIFMPVFVIGAGMGRLIGEVVAYKFPDGLRGDRHMLVYPGIYAVVGASSFCGAVTHTVSVAVIAFELTGQLLHILPVMIAVIIANIVCSSFQPSFFDSIIKIRHLPYLPDIPKSTSEVHSIRAEQIMVTNVKFLSKASTYGELQDLLIAMPRLRAFPVVDSPDARILLGSISRASLLQLLDAQVGEVARRAEAAKRIEQERESLASYRKKPVFSIGSPSSPETARKKAVENFFADTYAKPTALDRFRLLSLHPLHCSLSNHRFDNHHKGGKETDDQAKHSHSSKLNVAKISSAPPPEEINSAVTTKRLRRSSSMIRSFKQTFRYSRKRRVNNDLLPRERRDWERKQLACTVDFASAVIDPAPFQLVEDTSLYKVHSIFSLLGIRRAYVTKCGVLVGVVALRDLRSAIERAQWGELNSKTERIEENDAEVPAVDAERRLSAHSETHQTDLDSDTDDDDCILPRVEVEETTPSTCELDQRLPMAISSRDGSSDHYITDETDNSTSPISPLSSNEDGNIVAESGAIPDPSQSNLESPPSKNTDPSLPMELQSYLDANYADNNYYSEYPSAEPTESSGECTDTAITTPTEQMATTESNIEPFVVIVPSKSPATVSKQLRKIIDEQQQQQQSPLKLRSVSFADNSATYESDDEVSRAVTKPTGSDAASSDSIDIASRSITNDQNGHLRRSHKQSANLCCHHRNSACFAQADINQVELQPITYSCHHNSSFTQQQREQESHQQQLSLSIATNTSSSSINAHDHDHDNNLQQIERLEEGAGDGIEHATRNWDCMAEKCSVWIDDENNDGDSYRIDVIRCSLDPDVETDMLFDDELADDLRTTTTASSKLQAKPEFELRASVAYISPSLTLSHDSTELVSVADTESDHQTASTSSSSSSSSSSIDDVSICSTVVGVSPSISEAGGGAADVGESSLCSDASLSFVERQQQRSSCSSDEVSHEQQEELMTQYMSQRSISDVTAMQRIHCERVQRPRRQQSLVKHGHYHDKTSTLPQNSLQQLTMNAVQQHDHDEMDSQSTESLTTDEHL